MAGTSPAMTERAVNASENLILAHYGAAPRPPGWIRLRLAMTVEERAISAHIAAAGGNASLMTIG